MCWRWFALKVEVQKPRERKSLMELMKQQARLCAEPSVQLKQDF